jgi:hypothetical protein
MSKRILRNKRKKDNASIPKIEKGQIGGEKDDNGEVTCCNNYRYYSSSYDHCIPFQYIA